MRKPNWKFICNNKGFFDIVLPVLIGGLAGAGIAEGISSISKSPKIPDAPATPSQGAANQTGASTVADQRAAMLYAGGTTDMTGGLGVLTGENLSHSSLIGG